MVSKLKIHKSTIIFKINISKLIEKHPGIISDFEKEFSEELFEGHQENLQKNSSEFE